MTKDANRMGTRPEGAAMTSSHNAIIGMTRRAIISSWNPAAQRLYGYSAGEIVGRPAEVLYPPGRRPAEAEIMSRIVGGEEMGRTLTDRVRKDGTLIPVLLTASPAMNEHGVIVGATTVSRRPGAPRETRGRPGAQEGAGRADGERRKPDPGKTDRDAQVQQAQRLENLGQLAGGVAHDFNNLLAVILNYAAFVSDEMGAATSADWERCWATAHGDVGQIQQAAERAAALTRQLLAFARREVVRPRVLDLNKVIAGIEEMLRRTLGEHVRLAISPDPELWPILADPGQLEQVLVNLAVNARDAMPGGGSLTIDTSNVTVDADSIAGGSPARQGRNVRLRVSDTGTGMPADVAEHVFEPFFTTKAKGTGTGLGLATVYGILTQAEGHIRIYSEPGTGTTFSITLPITDQAAPAAPEPAPYRRIPRGETVLVVEDEEALREVTRRIFTRNGYQVLTAANGPEAFEIASRYDGDIHLLVTDVVMPHMLGKEVADNMRALRPGIEVLYMSGYARPVLASQGRLDPGVALVEKPFSEAELMATAGQVLNGHFKGFTTIQDALPLS
jgi:PAS domain S-box-containing protein